MQQFLETRCNKSYEKVEFWTIDKTQKHNK